MHQNSYLNDEMEKLSNNLFLLIANLAQQSNKENIINIFMQGINSFLPGVQFTWKNQWNENAQITVSTRKNYFGEIKFRKKSFSADKTNLALVQNTAQMLAILIERIEQEQLLNDQFRHLEILVDKKTHDLKKQNKELHKAKETIEESETIYKTLYNCTPVMMHSSDLEGEIISVNDYWLKTIGYNYDEVIGTKSSIYLSEKSRILYRSLIKTFLKKGNLNNIEAQVVKKNRTFIDVLISSKLLYDKLGNPLYSMTNMIDISLLTKAKKKQKTLTRKIIIEKEKAEASNHLKTEFLHNMSHEIRTPMNGIMGFLSILDKQDLSNSKREYYINIIQNSGNQLLQIIDDILEISKLETKQVEAFKEEVCLNDLLLELFSIFDMKAKENNISLFLKKELTDDESIIYTDKTKLNKILSNLIENALKFTNEGFVELGYRLKKKQLEIYVQDTGIGIESDKQNFIFERFSQAEKNIHPKLGGLGLGLSIAKENTELIGGKISLESQKGNGATFFITIPYKPVFSNLIAEKSIKRIQRKKKPMEEYTILVAEDEEVNYLLIDTILKEVIELNCHVIHARNGQEAVDICKRNDKIDLILMDLKMPIMNGIEATNKIKKIRSDIPIIAQTAYSSPEDSLRAKEAGCDDFMSKPIKQEIVNAMIEKHILNVK